MQVNEGPHSLAVLADHNDDGIAHLMRLASLEELNLRDTRVTLAAARKLMEALPGLTLYR